MSELFGSRIYRRSFSFYSVALLIALVAVYLYTQSSMMSTALLHYDYRASKCFESMEAIVDGASSDIDGYFLELYSDPELLEDFISFWNNDAEGYTAATLDQYIRTGKRISFTDKLASFLVSKTYCIREVVFVGWGAIKEMTIDAGGNCNFYYGVSYHNYLEKYSQSNCSYLMQIRDPENIKSSLGSIVFLFDEDRLIENCNTEFSHIALIRDLPQHSSRTAEPIIVNEDLPTWFVMGTSSVSDDYRRFSFFRPGYTFDYYSERLGFGVRIGVSRHELMMSEFGPMLLLSVALLTAYGVLLFLIGEHMKRESRFLTRIIGSIQSGHQGSFTRIDTQGRRDEYSAIANELNSMAEELEEYIRREYVLTIEQQEASMRALIYQINPHFLYNTLEVIRAGALKNGDEQTAQQLVSLAKIYRTLVKEDSVITLRKELELLRAYLELMECRYCDVFSYQIDVEESLMELKTVKFWMQPLVENFLVHGMDINSEFNLLIVRGREYEDRYVLSIIDNGKEIAEDWLTQINNCIASGEDSPAKEGIGILNVSKRLRSFYGNIGFELKRSEQKGLTVDVTIYREEA